MGQIFEITIRHYERGGLLVSMTLGNMPTLTLTQAGEHGTPVITPALPVLVTPAGPATTHTLSYVQPDPLSSSPDFAGLVPGPVDLAVWSYTENGAARSVSQTDLVLSEDGGPVQDISLALSAPLTSLRPPARVLTAPNQPGSFVHVLAALTVNEGDTAVITDAPPRLAIVRSYPELGDYQEGEWLTQGEETPLTYARLDTANLPAELALIRGCAYSVYVQVAAGDTTIPRRAPGEIIVC